MVHQLIDQQLNQLINQQPKQHDYNVRLGYQLGRSTYRNKALETIKDKQWHKKANAVEVGRRITN
jgi:hypothetical protein